MNKPGPGHRFAQENLSAYFDGELSERGTRRVERHLEQCAQCRQDLADLEWTIQLTAQLPMEPLPRSFVLPQSVQPVQTRHRRWSLAFSTLRGATAAVALLLALFVAGDTALRMASMPMASAVPDMAPRPMLLEKAVEREVEKAVTAVVAPEGELSVQPEGAPARAIATEGVREKTVVEFERSDAPAPAPLLAATPSPALMMAPRAAPPQPEAGSLDALEAPRGGGVGGGGGQESRAAPPAPMTTGARPAGRIQDAPGSSDAPVAKKAAAPQPTTVVCAAEAAEQAESAAQKEAIPGQAQAADAAVTEQAVAQKGAAPAQPKVLPTAAPAVAEWAPTAETKSNGRTREPLLSGRDPVMWRLWSVTRVGSVILLGVFLVLLAALIWARHKSRA